MWIFFDWWIVYTRSPVPEDFIWSPTHLVISLAGPNIYIHSNLSRSVGETWNVAWTAQFFCILCLKCPDPGSDPALSDLNDKRLEVIYSFFHQKQKYFLEKSRPQSTWNLMLTAPQFLIIFYFFKSCLLRQFTLKTC